MTPALGITAAFAAFLLWGLGDFFIQRSARKVGDWETLFFISLFGMIALFPFVRGELGALFSPSGSGAVTILLITSFVILFAALFDFEALKRGKISVVEPVLAFELPVSAAFAYMFTSESFTIIQIAAGSLLLVGIILVSMTRTHLSRRARILEKGVVMAGIGSIGLGVANFLVGYSARETGALMVNWFMSVFLTTATLVYIWFVEKRKIFNRDVRRNAGTVAAASILDTGAWVAFAYAAIAIPIGIAVAISESYLALAAILGVYINKERLSSHQKIGAALAIAMAIVLSITV